MVWSFLLKATSKFFLVFFVFFFVKHILRVCVCTRAHLSYFIIATSSHVSFATDLCGGFFLEGGIFFVYFASKLCLGNEWDATKVKVNRNGKFKWTFIPLIRSPTTTL